MSVVSVKARSFILALFIRDDGERFLLGDNGYDFKNSQLHFAANTIENDEVMKQGADGVIVAGQVRRASVQSFDGFVGDATMAKETIEQMRRDFFAFFVKSHHFRVIYIDCNRNAWQRKGGYLVDAPEVKELWQIHPEYHVGLNFEDVNYYSYDEDADGEEILSNLVDVPVSTAASGGLVWDEDGAVSEDAEVEYDIETAGATGKAIAISDAAEAPLASFKLDGETSQNGTPTPSAPVAVSTTTGENVVKISDGQNEQSYEVNLGKNLFDKDNANVLNGYIDSSHDYITSHANNRILWIKCEPNTQYVISVLATSWNRAIAWSSDEPAVGVQTFNRINLLANSTSATFTTGALANYIVFRFWASTLSSETYQQAIDSIQIEKGSQATSYAPYFTPIELCKIGDYQDSIYKSGGKWYVHKAIGKVIADGNTVWAKSQFGANNYGFAKNDVKDVESEVMVISDQTTGVSYWNRISAGMICYYTANQIFIRNIDIDTAADLTTHCASNPMTFYYVLATPADTEITNQALIEQLEAVLGGHTYAGTNNIFTVTPNEQGTLEIGYYTKYQLIVTGGGYVWEAGGAGGATIVVNNSIDNVNPIWKIYGPTMNPQLENSTTGEVIEYVGLIAEGQTLTIDMGEQTASLDGLNVISNLVGDFVSLAPGANRLIYSVSGDAGASEIGWSEIVG